MGLVNPPRYETAADASSRLGGSLLRYKGKPVWIAEVRPDQSCIAYHLNELRRNIDPFHASDEELDISSPPLGYLNYGTDTYYLTRMAKRGVKQGLCHRTVQVKSENREGKPIATQHLFPSKEIEHVIINNYPSAKECLEMLNNSKLKVNSISFARKWALVKDNLGIIKLHHMTRPVGYLTDESGRLRSPKPLHPFFMSSLESMGLQT